MTKTPLVGPKTLILIWLLEQGETNAIAKIIKFSFQRLFMGRNRSWKGQHNFWSDRWIFKFHTFLELGSQDISKGVKIDPIRGSWGWQPFKGCRRPYKGCCLEKCVGAINSPRHPLDQKKRGLPRFCSLPGGWSWASLSLTDAALKAPMKEKWEDSG